MKPPAFDYVSPSSVDEALAEISRHGGEARPLAGGQSLIPMLNFRLLSPTVLVDLRLIPELTAMEIGTSHIHFGAMTRTARLLDAAVASACPILSDAASNIAHPQIRNRGTIGGSISNADPAAELPAIALLTGARMHVAGPSGRRVVDADEYFLGLFTTACEWDEILTGVDVPVLAPGTGWGFREYTRRPGDFAVAGAGVLATVENDFFTSAKIVVFGVSSAPVRMANTEQALLGQPAGEETLSAVRAAFDAELEADDSPFSSADYKRRVAWALFGKALSDAARRARGVSQ